jgi:serine/threonine protein kinase
MQWRPSLIPPQQQKHPHESEGEFIPHTHTHKSKMQFQLRLLVHSHLQMRIISDIIEGMRFLHSASPPIIHRDLKSPNILLGHENAPVIAKLSDFATSVQLSIISGRSVDNRAIFLFILSTFIHL